MNTNTLTKEKIASILEPHAQHFAFMQARGKSLSDMLYWLRTTHNWVLNPAQLERFLNQKESATQAQAETTAKTKTDAELEYQQLMSSPAATVYQPTTLNNKPVAPGLATTAELEYQQLMSSPTASVTQPTTLNNQLSVATLMNQFKQVLSRVMDKSDDSPETLKMIDKMMHTVIGYEQGKERLEQIGRTIKIKEDDHQMKVSKANINNPGGDDVKSLSTMNPQPSTHTPPPVSKKVHSPQNTASGNEDTGEGELVPSLSTMNSQPSTHS